MIGVDAFHVHPSYQGGWRIRRTKHQHGLWYAIKADAVKEARAMARKAGISLYIHRKDGTVCEKVVRD